MHIPIYNLGLLRQRMFSWPKFWQVFFHRQIMKPRSVAASSLAVIIPCSQWVSKQLTISLNAPLEGHISANVANYQADISSSWVGRPYGSADIKTISSNWSHFLQGSCFFWVIICSPMFLFLVTDQASVLEEFTFGSEKCSHSPSFFID